MRLRLAFLALAASTGLSWMIGCDAGSQIEIHVGPQDKDGGAGDADSGADGEADDGGGADGDAGSGQSSVLLAISPTPSSADGEPSAADQLAADLTTFGAGARAEVIVLPWDEAPFAEDEELSKRSAFYGEHGKRVLLNLAVVDRRVDRRPASLGGAAWDSQKTVAAALDAVDALFASTGDEVRFITLGRDVDVYLAEHPDERDALVTFSRKVCAYAREHTEAPADLGVGVAFTTAAPAGEAAFKELLADEDVIVLSYLPGLGTFEPDAASGAAAVLAGLADLGTSKPIVLQAAGFPASAAAGGSEVAQQKFFTTLLGAAGTQRRSFALINVVELNDAPPGACAAWAEEQGGAPGDQLTAYACSLGLLRPDGTPRPAWDAVLAGAAALSSP